MPDTLNPPAWWEGKQKLVNARPVPARYTRATEPIPIRARLEWAEDGVEHIDTMATAWTHSLVLVDVTDPRCMITAAWIPLEHITRR